MNNRPDFNRFPPDIEKLTLIIKKGDVQMLNDHSKELGEGLKYEFWKEKGEGKEKKIIKEKELTRSQIRNILYAIQSIRFDENTVNKLHLLRPKLAYLAGRHGGRVREFKEIIEKAILMVTNEKEFENFKNFVEAIVAYHRYYGGKE